MCESYYEVLGVASDASAEAIERAYRERVLETHPDRNDDPDAADQFRTVSTAADVLTDETERAKYDRLGHEAYCGDGSGTPTDDDESPSDTDPHWPSAEWWEQYATTERQSGGTDRSGPSHHARQRARRERRSNPAGRWRAGGATAGEATAGAEATGDRSASRSGGTSWRRATAQRRGAAGRHRSGFDWGKPSNGTESRRRPTGPHAGEDQEFSGFAVHQWDDDVELASPFRSLDAQTLVFACGLALLYPVFVYTTITPHLPLLVNLVIGCCTLVLIGYLLTLPRIALASFGSWSLLATLALLVGGSAASISLVGIGMLAGFWIPFGYAVGVWVALRP